MPFVTKPAATVTWTLMDITGSKSYFSLNFPSGTTIAAIRLKAATVIPLLESFSGCAVIAQSITWADIQTDSPQVTTDARVERKGVLSFRTAAGKIVSYSIPGINPSWVKDSGQIDEDSAGAATLIASILGAEDGQMFCDSNGSDIVSLVEAYERFSSTTRKQKPSTRTPDPDPDPGN